MENFGTELQQNQRPLQITNHYKDYGRLHI